MQRNRSLVLAAVVAAVAATVAPAAAQAATASTPASYVSVQLATQPYDANGNVFGSPTPLDPTSTGSDGVRVRFFQYDSATGFYQTYRPTGTWTNVSGNTWESPALDPGTYRIMFLPVSTSMSLGYLGTGESSGVVPFFNTDWTSPDVKTTDVVVQATDTSDQPQSLGSVTLQQQRLFYTDRLQGADRFSTAVAISQAMFPGDNGAANPPAAAPGVVYLVNGLNYPDALAAGPAAIAQGGGLLLTSTTSLPASTSAELKRLKPTRLVIAGGTGAVSDAVMNAAGIAAGVTPERIGGTDRYDTAAKIARDAFITHHAGTDPGVNPNAIVLVATGADYPDALAAGPAAGTQGAPLILVDGKAKTVPASTQQLLQDLNAKHVGVVGGTGAVSAGIFGQLNTIYPGATRYSGASRYDTAQVIGDTFFYGSETVALANGLNFPDALAGGPFAALVLGAPVYLTPPTCLGSAAINGMFNQHSNEALLLGGPGALSSDVEDLYLCAGASEPVPHNSTFPSGASATMSVSSGDAATGSRTQTLGGDRKLDVTADR